MYSKSENKKETDEHWRWAVMGDRLRLFFVGGACMYLHGSGNRARPVYGVLGG